MQRDQRGNGLIVVDDCDENSSVNKTVYRLWIDELCHIVVDYNWPKAIARGPIRQTVPFRILAGMPYFSFDCSISYCGHYIRRLYYTPRKTTEVRGSPRMKRRYPTASYISERMCYSE